MKTCLLFILVSSLWLAVALGGGDSPDPWPTVQRHATLNNFPQVSEQLIAPSYFDSGTTRYALWPSWDGSHFQLAYSVRIDGSWSSVVYLTNSTTQDSLSPALALIDGGPIGLYAYGDCLRSAIKTTSWSTYHIMNGAFEDLAAHQESGHTWWTWRDGNHAKWIERVGDGWSSVGSEKIQSGDFEAAVAAIRATVLGQ